MRDPDDVENAIDQLEADVEELGTQVDQLQTAETTLTEQVADLLYRIRTLEADDD